MRIVRVGDKCLTPEGVEARVYAIDSSRRIARLATRVGRTRWFAWDELRPATDRAH